MNDCFLHLIQLQKCKIPKPKKNKTIKNSNKKKVSGGKW